MKRFSLPLAGILLPLVLLTSACKEDTPEGTPAVTGLKDVFADAFLVGAALNPDQVNGRDTVGVQLIKQHFNTITPENVMKWERIHPEPGKYNFEEADRIVQFGEENGIAVIGHTLVWHSQTPRWVFQDAQGNPVSRDTLLARMRDHIHTVVGRYKGRIKGWDVVNEAISDGDGSLRQSPWLKIIGDDYIAQAFRFAHEADSTAELYYNDYSMPYPAKRDGAVRLVQSLKEQGVPIYGIGMQGHYKMDTPSVGLVDTAITMFAAAGVKVMITEFDIDVLPQAVMGQSADIAQRAALRDSLNPYTAGLPDSVQTALAERYASLFDVLVKHRDVVDRVTFWGVRDGDSWLNGWPVPGRTAYPLLFDREGKPKPAYAAVVRTAAPQQTPAQ